jgi:hypothetical protein
MKYGKPWCPDSNFGMGPTYGAHGGESLPQRIPIFFLAEATLQHFINKKLEFNTASRYSKVYLNRSCLCTTVSSEGAVLTGMNAPRVW